MLLHPFIHHIVQLPHTPCCLFQFDLIFLEKQKARTQAKQVFPNDTLFGATINGSRSPSSIALYLLFSVGQQVAALFAFRFPNEFVKIFLFFYLNIQSFIELRFDFDEGKARGQL